jgi:signal transduction histidine kinase
MKKLLLLIILSGFHYAERAVAQTPSSELGSPLITTWTPQDYGADPTNRSIVQDDRGVIYVCNNSGILEYDGVSWRLIALPDMRNCFSMARNSSGRIFVGGGGELGYLSPDLDMSGGNMRFVSLLPLLPEEMRDFRQVISINVVNDIVYFNTGGHLFRFTPTDTSRSYPDMSGEIYVWKTDHSFHYGYQVYDEFYIQDTGKGLMHLQGDSLHLVPGGEQFSNVIHGPGVTIQLMLPYAYPHLPAGNHQTNAGPQHRQPEPSHRQAEPGRDIGSEPFRTILVGDPNRGLFLYDGQTFHPFETEADEYLLENWMIFPGAALSDGRLLLNTLFGGVVMLDHNGKHLQTINRSKGLPNNRVSHVYPDPIRPETIWMALDNSIARVEVAGPYSRFNADQGLESAVTQIQRHRGVLYAATGSGIFYLDPATEMFKPEILLPGRSGMVAFDDNMLVSNFGGVFSIDREQGMMVQRSVTGEFFRAIVTKPSNREKGLFFVGLTNGLAALRLENGVLQHEGHAPGIQDEIRTLVETDDGTLWAGTQTSGVLRLTFPGNGELNWQDVQVESFGTGHGLPDGWVRVQKINDTPYFSTYNNIYRFDAANQQFVQDSTFMVVAGNPGWALFEDGREQVWVLGRGMAMGTRQADGEYQWLKDPFRRFSDNIFYTVYPDKNGVVWFGGPDGIIRYDSKVEVNYTADYPALVRRVVTGDESIIFNGAEGLSPTAPAIAYANNNLRFAYSASAYEDPVRLQFQTRLEGFDREWSGWSNRTEREFTNLPPGDYRFRVRAMNIYDHVSREAAYSFTILPPWWRTWWAYGVYFFLFGLAVLATDRVQRRRLLKKERERSEAQRKELELQKAAELKLAYDKLEKAHEHLKSAQDQLVQQEKLASLGQLTAGIAHEIKNPLNFVNNFSDVSLELIEEAREEVRRVTEDGGPGSEKAKVKRQKSPFEGGKNDKVVQGDEEEPGYASNPDLILEILDDIESNLRKIHEHGSRADGIVKSMLQHSRGGDGKMEPTDLNALVKEYVNLAFHGMRAGKDPINVDIELDLDDDVGDVPLIAEDFSRVILNLCNNAFDAMRTLSAERLAQSESYSPKLTVSTKSENGAILIEVKYNGPGIPDEIKDKILQPFFTTKKGTQGTGLGLSITHDIVKAHGGDIAIDSSPQGTTFKISLKS